MAKHWLAILLFSAVAVSAQSWQVLQFPADLDKGRDWMTVVAGHGNPIAMAFRTTAENLKNDQDLMLEYIMPVEFELFDTSKEVTEHQYTRKVIGKQKIVTDSFRHSRHRLSLLNKGTGEWRTHKILLKVPEQVADDARLIMRLHHKGKMELERQWAIRATKLENTEELQLKKLIFGLYDYGFGSSLEKSGDEMLNLFLAVGVNQFFRLHTDRRPEGFSWLGSVHHDYFHSSQHPNVRVDGTVSRGGFCDNEAVIALGAEAVIPRAIERLVAEADKSGSNEAYVNYEPSGLSGFSEMSIKKFLAAYQVSEKDFAHFQKLYAQEKFQLWRNDDPVVKEVYPKWVAFNSRQSAEYVGAIAKAFKAKRPNARFWITQSGSVGAEDRKTIALGNDNASMAAYLDGVHPQIYYGYGAAAAKHVVQVVGRWCQEVNRLNPNCLMVPLLLNRYAGASVKNSPEMVRLQGLASVANGADGVSYYFVQHFDGEYYPHLLQMRKDMARYEDFYVDGKRVDQLFELANSNESTAIVNSWPGVQYEIKNPQWFVTAHQLETKVLLTMFNFDKDNELAFTVKTKANFQSAENCDWEQGNVLIPTAEAAFIIFEL